MNIENENLCYQPMSTLELMDAMDTFQSQLRDFLSASGYESDVNVFVSKRALIDMIIRTDKRKAYYQCFHRMKINECKVAALYIYWLLKFRPITIADTRYEGKRASTCVNEAFAIFVVFATLKRVHGIAQLTMDKYSYYDKLLYSFRFRNISIDAMILLVESISQGTLDMRFEQLEDFG
jgi:hypothetical protein